jgi:hypothetical protein
MCIREAQKHKEPTDPDATLEHWFNSCLLQKVSGRADHGKIHKLYKSITSTDIDEF